MGDNSCIPEIVKTDAEIAAGKGTCSGVLVPTHPNHGFFTTLKTNGLDGVFIVPRFATDIYFDCATESGEVAQYVSIWC